MHLHSIVSETQSRSLDEFIVMVKLCQQQYEYLYHMAFIQFVKLCPKLKDKEVLYMLTGGKCQLRQLSEILCTAEKDIIEYNGKIEPHLLYISPLSYNVHIGAHFVHKLVYD